MIDKRQQFNLISCEKDNGKIGEKGHLPVRRVPGTLLLDGKKKSVSKAALILSKGGLVAFPTETVYGLGAAVNQIRAISGFSP